MNIDENNKEDVNNDSPDEYNIINHKKENEYTKKNYRLNIAMAIIATLGIVFLIFELLQLREQNKLTKTAFEKTLEPLGFIEVIKEDTSLFFIQRDETRTIAYTIDTEEKFNNVGKGVLFYIGNFTFSSNTFIDLIPNDLVKKLKAENIHVMFDAVYTEYRRKIILPGKSGNVPIIWYDVKLTEQIYLYAVLFYKDVNDNLYDTIILNREMNRFNKYKTPYEKMHFNQYPHKYTKAEQKEIYKYVKSYKAKEYPDGHPMAEYLK